MEVPQKSRSAHLAERFIESWTLDTEKRLKYLEMYNRRFSNLGKERPSTRVMKRDLPKRSRDLNLNHHGKVFAKYFMGPGATPHSLTMQIGMPLENIIELMKGQRSFNPLIVLVLEQCFGPPVRSLVDLQVIYDLEERVFFLEGAFDDLSFTKNGEEGAEGGHKARSRHWSIGLGEG